MVGILLGTLIGQSVWAMRGLDPIFQVLRTISPLAWLPISLAAFRDSQPSAIFVIFITAIWPIIINTAVGIRNIPQDYRNVAAVLRLNHARVLLEDHDPVGGALHLHGPAHRHRPVVARHRRRRDADRRRRHRLLHLGCVEFTRACSDIVVALVYIGIVGFVLDRIVALIARIVTRGTASKLRRTDQ